MQSISQSLSIHEQNNLNPVKSMTSRYLSLNTKILTSSSQWSVVIFLPYTYNLLLLLSFILVSNTAFRSTLSCVAFELCIWWSFVKQYNITIFGFQRRKDNFIIYKCSIFTIDGNIKLLTVVWDEMLMMKKKWNKASLNDVVNLFVWVFYFIRQSSR